MSCKPSHILFLALCSLVLGTQATAQDSPFVLSYQGVLANADGSPLADGSYDITFRIYDTASGGNALWTEGQTLQVRNGVFITTLGSASSLTEALDFDEPYWLSVRLEGGAELNPRVPITSSAYSFFAQDIPDESVTSGKLRDGAVSSSKLSDNAVTADKIANGSIGLTKLSASGAENGEALVFDGTGLTWGAPSNEGVITGVEAGAGLNGGGTNGTVTLSIPNNGIITAMLANNAVTAAKIAAGAIETPNIANGAIGSAKLANSGVEAQNIANGAVTPVKINAAGATSGQVLGFNGTDVVWTNGAVGDITAVTAGQGLSGGGLVGEVTLNIADGGVTAQKLSVPITLQNTSGAEPTLNVINPGGAEAARFEGGVLSEGNLSVIGTLTKSSGTFKIDHPLEPEKKYLYHSFVESPDMMNVYNGNVVLDGNGEADVEMPAYFEALNKDFRYQLTCLGGYAPVYVAGEMDQNRFKIAGGTPGLKVSWQVTGIRHDPYAEQNRVQVEVDKPLDEQGTYLNPEAYGKSKKDGVASRSFR